MRLIDAEQYRKEFLDSRDFEPMKILDFQPTIQAIPISDNATNGDVMKVIFPNIEANEVKTDTGGYIEVKYLDTTDKCDATAFRKNWWNALYKRGSENDI